MIKGEVLLSNLSLFCNKLIKEDVLLRCEIFLKSFVKKSNFQTVIVAIIFMTMNEHAYKLFKNILNYIQKKGQQGDNLKD